MAAPQMLRAPGAGLGIQLHSWPGPEPPVVAVHGLTANGRCWETIARELAGGRRLVALDLRGRGGSDKPEHGYDLEHHCADLDGVLDDLGQPRAVLMGHSLGAYISLAYAATRPQRVERLILVDGGAVLNPEQWGKVAQGIGPSLERLAQVYASAEEMLAQVRQAPFLQPWNQATEDYYRYDCIKVPGGVKSGTSSATVAEERANLNKVDFSRFYPQVRCPVLVLRAGQGMLAPDQLVLPDDATARLLRDLPQARLVELDRLNHFSIIFQPSPQRAQAVKEFLAA
jgi:pimeloyl-ACP methyl ester carboxylesterase